MPRIQEIDIGDGQTVKGIELDFQIRQEEWNEYALVDGGTLRVKITLLQAFQEVGDDGQATLLSDGTPVIRVKSVNHVVYRA